MQSTPLKLNTLVAFTSFVLALGALLFVCKALYGVLALLCAVLIATYILILPVNLLEKAIQWGYTKIQINRLVSLPPVLTFFYQAFQPRVLAVIGVFLLGIIILSFSLFKTIPLLQYQLGELGEKLGTQIIQSSNQFFNWLSQFIGKETVNSLLENFSVNTTELKTATSIKSNLFNKALGQLETVLASAVPNVLSFAGGTIESFVYGVAGLMLTFYFLLDGHYFKPWVLTFINKEAKPAVAYVLQSFHQVMLSFIKGQVMLGILTGIYMFIVYLGFNVPYALLLAVIFAIAEFIPVLGTYIGVFFGFTVIIFTRDPVTLFWVWFFSYAFQTVKDNILAPKVVGDVMGLHPMVIILALLLCAKVAGFLGILIALPLASSVNVLIKFLKEPKNIKKIDEL